MHQLLILRHAKSSWDSADTPDQERPLNPRGQRAAALLRQALTTLTLEPDIILVSTARRTLETLERLEPWPHTPLVERLDTLYLASVDQLFATLQAVPETARSVLLIGHNPGLHELALSLVGDPGAEHQPPIHALTRGFPSGALAEFAIPGPWSRLTGGGGRLIRVLTPRDLEAGA